MFVLYMQKDQSIMIGEDIEVMLVKVKKDRISLGIQAPIDIPVHRGEIYEAIQRENRSFQDKNDRKYYRLEDNYFQQIDSTSFPMSNHERFPINYLS